jgi:hypothetical protein
MEFCLKLHRSRFVLSLAGAGAILGALLLGVVGALGCSSSSGGSAGPGDGGGGGVDGGNCSPGSVGPCTSYTTPEGDSGTTITLGPYGSITDPNVGKGFENAIQNGDTPGSTFCQSFIDLGFDPDPSFSAQVNQLLTGTAMGITVNYALYTVYRPATWPSTPVPVITWGNGTCAPSEGYGALLRYVASYGFFVVAANSREVGSGTPPPMVNALNYAESANKDPTSPYYQKLDMTRVGAMGHSQGGQATVTAAQDSRVKDIIIFNALDSASKPYLAVSGDLDITNYTPASMASAINESTVPAAWLYFHMIDVVSKSLSGHLLIMTQPERVTEPTVKWWQMMLQGNTSAQSEFLGSNCNLCNMSAEFQYGENGLPGTADGGLTPGSNINGSTSGSSEDAAAGGD